MSDTSRHISPRRSTASANRTPGAAPLTDHLPASTARVDALRRLVAAGQYHVSAKWLAHRMLRCAGVPIDE